MVRYLERLYRFTPYTPHTHNTITPLATNTLSSFPNLGGYFYALDITYTHQCETVMQTRKSVSFKILSDISSQDDVFDHLLPVRRLDTGEEGTLLCSHYCAWPTDLIEKATWLEGCFTPKEYKDEPRLVLGYHRGDITHWEHDVQPDGSVHLTVYIFSYEVLEVDLPVPLRQYDDDDVAWYPRRRVMDRLWRSARRAAPDADAALPAYYREVVSMVQRGKLNAIVAASYLPKGMTRWQQNEPRFIQGSYWGQVVGDEECLFFTYYDRLVVCEDKPGAGYLEAIPLYRRPRQPGRIIGFHHPAPGDFKYHSFHTYM